MSKVISNFRLVSQITVRSAACLVALLIVTAAANAATYTVDTTADNIALTACTGAEGDCSLRGAINNANGTLAADTITFAIPAADPNCPSGVCTITLTASELGINSAVTAGALTITNSTGASNLLISGNNASRVFLVNGGANLTLNGLTITMGLGTGAGIRNNAGTVTVTSSVIRGNTTSLFGGGIFSEAGTVTLTNSTISGNSANANGGGIYSSSSTLTVSNSTVSGNTSSRGGGIFCIDGTATLTKSTVSGNAASYGGGIDSFSTGLYLTSTTVAFNIADNSGGGVHIGGDSGANLLNTIVAGNGGNALSPDFSGEISWNTFGSTFNLIGDGTGMSGIPIGYGGNQIGTSASPIDARLGALADNGGTTQTHALLGGSRAIDSGNTTGTDQRGLSRPFDHANYPNASGGNAADIGAFEAQVATVGVYTVDTTADDPALTACTPAAGDCSLRGSLSAANATIGNDTIGFAIDASDTGCSGGVCTITLTLGELTLYAGGTMTISNSSGAGSLLISGNAASTVFVVNSDADVTLDGLTILNGHSFSDGGGIHNRGRLSLTNSTVRGNTGSNNGGGIYNSGTLSGTTSSVSENTATGYAGGIYNIGTLSLTRSSIRGNSANTASGLGGGIFNASTATLTNSTVSGNAASVGAGIYNGSTLNLSSVTLAYNTAVNGPAGGIFTARATANLTNTIVANNSAAYSSREIGGPISSTSSFNLIGDGTGSSGITHGLGHNQVGTGANPIDPKLNPIALNDGATLTHSLQAGSPAIDKGNASGTDQRGLTRPVNLTSYPNEASGNGSDIGAFEAQIAPTVSYTVDTTSDSANLSACTDAVNDCSLRGALGKANATFYEEVITFAIPAADTNCPGGVCTIALTGGQLVINPTSTAGSLSISNSTGASNLLISAGGASPVFSVSAGADLTLDGATVTHGNSVNGGGISNLGSLSLMGSVITANTANYGAGIYNSGGTVTLSNSTVSGNTASQFGGGIYNSSGGVTTIRNSTISGNLASLAGGGIFSGGTLNLTAVTVAYNRAVNNGGGIFSGVSTANFINTIIAQNGGNTNSPDFAGTVSASSEVNLIGNGTGAGGVTDGTSGNQVGTSANPIDPRLAPVLALNGGPTLAHALLAQSPAIDSGSNAAAAGLTTDQRGAGFPRIVDGNNDGTAIVDIGAFEHQAQTTTTITSQPQGQSVCETAAANFAVGATGESLTYQWRRNGFDLIDSGAISGATTANLAINSVAAIDAGTYDVVVSGTSGATTSDGATLSVNSAPAITGQPVDQNVNSGSDALFTTSASGAQSVQWQLSTDGGSSFGDIIGATSETLVLPAVTSAQHGRKYRALFTGACGAPATSAAATLTVSRLDQTITFNVIANKTYGDAPFALSASSTSNLPVGFSIVSGAATISSGTLTINGAGMITIRAEQSGDADHNAAPSVERSFNVAKAQATITLSGLAPTYDGTSKAATAGTTPEGLNVTLTYSHNGVPVVSPINAGSYTVSASVVNANYEGTATDTLTIAKAMPVIAWSNPADIAYGAPLGATQLNATTTMAGAFVYTPAAGAVLGAGAQNLSVTFTPNAANNYETADKSVTINVTQATQTITFSNPGTKALGTAPFGLGGSASSGLTVSYTVDSGPATVSGSTLTITGAGSVTVRASQSGNGNYNAAPDVSQTFTVNKAALLVTALNISGTYSDALPTLSYAITGFINGDAASVVTGAPALGTTAMVVNGNITSGAGTYPITATLGNLSAANYSFNFAGGVLTVSKETTVTDYTGDNYAVTAGPNVSTASGVRLAAHFTQQADGALGDLTLAKGRIELYKFSNTTGTPNYVFGNLAVTASGDVETTASLSVDDAYTVRVVVESENGFWTASANEGTLTIAPGTTEKRVSGAGSVADADTANGKGNFGFTVNYGKSGTLKGNALYAFRGTDGFNYRVKSTSWQGGGLTFYQDAAKAAFMGKGNVQKIDPVTGVVVESWGNYSFTVDLIDGSLRNPSESDRYAIQILNDTGALWRQIGSRTNPLQIAGGNISVRSK